MAIDVSGVSYKYGARLALDNVSLVVGSGKIAGLLGANGAGKSTLLRVLCGLLKPVAGSATIAGHVLPRDVAFARASTGYVSQLFGLYEDLTVRENVEFYARAYGLEDPVVAKRFQHALERFELGDRRNERAGRLSHGWRQRLALACSLTHLPQVLLLDEATAGLDPPSRKLVWRILEEERARGAAVLLSTHHTDEAALCDSVVWLDGGRVAQPASGWELK
jgi:ABC-2 type transport system ATP-binding protein